MKASMTQEEPRVTPHPASWKALREEIAAIKAEREMDKAMLAAQDARLAKAGADIKEHLETIRIMAQSIADLDRIAASRLDDVVSLRARVIELEAGFDLRWKADMRAIDLWKTATGRELPRPDHADLCVWLMGKIIEQNAAIKDLGNAGQAADNDRDDARHEMHLAHIHAAELMEEIAKLEPIAEVGRLVSLLRPGNRLCHASKGGAWYVHVIGGEPEADESTPLGALRAAGIGEEKP